MIAVVRRRAPRQYVDLSSVPPSQWSMHDRLVNWARWCRGTQRQVGAASPMFALYRSTEARREHGAETSVPVNKLDAEAVHSAVAVLPHKHRRAIHWCYLHPRNPSGMARELGVGMDGLANLVRDGRQMLVNRNV